MMGFMQFFAMLAKFEPTIQGQPLGKMPALLMKDVLLIVAAALAVLLVLLLWARYLRNVKPKKHRTGGQKVIRDVSESETQDEEDERTAELRRRYKFRYKRRDHRSRNPTLAETGGLPPARTEEQTKPS